MTGWETDEGKALLDRIRLRKASVNDRLKFAELELREALLNLPPTAYTKGAVDEGDIKDKKVSDPWHASACVLRALGELLSAKEKLEAGEDGRVRPLEPVTEPNLELPEKLS